MTDEELKYILNSIEDIISNIKTYSLDYNYSPKTNEFYHKNIDQYELNNIESWFNFLSNSN